MEKQLSLLEYEMSRVSPKFQKVITCTAKSQTEGT